MPRSKVKSFHTLSHTLINVIYSQLSTFKIVILGGDAQSNNIPTASDANGNHVRPSEVRPTIG